MIDYQKEAMRLKKALEGADRILSELPLAQDFTFGTAAYKQQQAVIQAHRIVFQALHQPEFLEYEGVFEAFNEQGMEGHSAMCIMDNRGITHVQPTTPNDPGRRYSFEWLFNLHSGDEIQVFNPADDKLVWSGTITKDRSRQHLFNGMYDFIPKEIDPETWMQWFSWVKPYKVKLKRKNECV